MRLSRDEALMATAYLWADRGTCERLKVGCVISREGRILVQGYNGSPPGLPHCPSGAAELDHKTNECLAVHAEQNAIAWAARNGVALQGAEVHVTHWPCLQCARSIITAGITSVMYSEQYRDSTGLMLLREAGLNVVKGSLDWGLQVGIQLAHD